MSPNNPSNFVSDLVEMAKAFEELPRVREALDIANDAIEDYAKQVQRLEMRHIERTAELDALNSRIRSLEVERDEAQFHALEADDRTARALDFIKATFGNAGSLIQALEPPRVDAPQPMDAAAGSVKTATGSASLDEHLGITAEGMPINSPEPEGVSVQAGEPAASVGTPWPNATSEVTAQTSPIASAEPSPAPEVATTPDPTPTATTEPNGSINTASASPASPDAPPTPNAYAGRTYSEVVKTGHYPTRDEWHAGGGTVDNWYA